MKIIKHSYKKLFLCSLIFLSISFNSLILSNTLESESLTKGDDKYLKQDGIFIYIYNFKNGWAYVKVGRDNLQLT